VCACVRCGHLVACGSSKRQNEEGPFYLAKPPRRTTEIIALQIFVGQWGQRSFLVLGLVLGFSQDLVFLIRLGLGLACQTRSPHVLVNRWAGREAGAKRERNCCTCSLHPDGCMLTAGGEQATKDEELPMLFRGTVGGGGRRQMEDGGSMGLPRTIDCSPSVAPCTHTHTHAHHTHTRTHTCTHTLPLSRA
jgi:hypothetical protein